MAINDSSIDWLDDLIKLKAQVQANPSITRDALAKALNRNIATIKRLLKITDCFDAEAIEKVRRAAQGVGSPMEPTHPKLGPQPEASAHADLPSNLQGGRYSPDFQKASIEGSGQGHIFSLNNALALTRLKNRVTDLLGTVHIVLDRAISDRLKTTQIEALVDHIIKGEPPEDFDHKKVKRRSSKGKSQKKTEETDDDSEDGDDSEDDSNQGNGTSGKRSGRKKRNKSKSKTTAKPLTETQKLLWDALLGGSVFHQVKAKVKKGESPSVWILLLLVVTQLVGWTHHYGWRFIKFCSKHFIKALERLGKTFPWLKHLFQFLFNLAIVVAGVWISWKVWHHEFHLPVLWHRAKEQALVTPISKPEMGAIQSQPPVKVTQAKSNPVKRKGVSEPPPPAAVHEGDVVPFSGDDGDKLFLQAAIGTFPSDPCKVKPYPVTPDSSINPLMATNRVGDLAVESEYSLRVGQGGQKIVSVTPSATGLIIAAEGGLPLGGILGDGSKLGFYWEDVQAIYCDELDTPSKKIYFFVLKAANLNQPLVVECNNPNNLGHLVSAFEYFIKTAQGKRVPVTGMPYLNQGLVLGDEGKITAIWQNSPADNGELQLGDHLWSVHDEVHKSPSELETALQDLPSGKQAIEVVTPQDWNAEAEKENRLKSKNFHPNLLDVELAVP